MIFFPTSKKSQSQQSCGAFLKNDNGIFTPRNGNRMSQQSCGVQEKKQRLLFCTEILGFLVSDPFLGNKKGMEMWELVLLILALILLVFVIAWYGGLNKEIGSLLGKLTGGV